MENVLTQAAGNEPMATKAEVKIFEEVLLKDPRGFFYVNYLDMVRKAIAQDPTLAEPGHMTKKALQKKLNHHIAYR